MVKKSILGRIFGKKDAGANRPQKKDSQGSSSTTGTATVTGTANSGEEAITATKDEISDIIFIDMKLPTLNGLETYLAIKKIYPQAVAVMMTAYRQEMSELVEQAIHNNAYTCLYKPLDMSVMLSLIAEILSRKTTT